MTEDTRIQAENQKMAPNGFFFEDAFWDGLIEQMQADAEAQDKAMDEWAIEHGMGTPKGKIIDDSGPDPAIYR